MQTFSTSTARPLEEIDIHLKTRLDRKRSNDTTSNGSNVTVIEGNIPDEVASDDGERDDELESQFTSSVLSSEKCAAKSFQLTSCLFRRDSARASIKKKVRCSDSAEVIPVTNYFINNDDWLEMPHEDDDDVFSDSAPVQTLRGNMCTPYVERKGSLPGLEALPDWFPNSRLFNDSIYPLCLDFMVYLFYHSTFCFQSSQSS